VLPRVQSGAGLVPSEVVPKTVIKKQEIRMRIKTKKSLATVVLVVGCLIFTQLEPAAFGQTPPPAQTQTAPPATPPADPQAPPAEKKKSKWKLILLSAATAGAVAAVFLIKNRKKPTPTVTLGGPTVGNP
jgi:hypothetical protein